MLKVRIGPLKGSRTQAARCTAFLDELQHAGPPIQRENGRRTLTRRGGVLGVFGRLGY